jgi:hypothetical protein
MLRLLPDAEIRRPPDPSVRGGPDAATMAAIRAHPGFAGAARAAGRGLLDLYQGHRLLNLVANDRGRAFVGILALHLHGAEPGGITAGRVKAICATLDLCSPGRAGALLALMRWSGHLVPEPGPDRRTRRLVPSPAFVALHRARIGSLLAAMSPLLPGPAGAALAALESDTDAFLAAFASAQVRRFLAGFRFTDLVPEVAGFIDRNAGLLVLVALRLADEERPGSTSVAGLAKRFHTSRAHIRGLLRDAGTAGLASLAPGGAGASCAELERVLDTLFAALFAFNAACAEEALDARRAATEPSRLAG